jgi:hypothetical protein
MPELLLHSEEALLAKVDSILENFPSAIIDLDQMTPGEIRKYRHHMEKSYETRRLYLTANGASDIFQEMLEDKMKGVPMIRSWHSWDGYSFVVRGDLDRLYHLNVYRSQRSHWELTDCADQAEGRRFKVTVQIDNVDVAADDLDIEPHIYRAWMDDYFLTTNWDGPAQ